MGWFSSDPHAGFRPLNPQLYDAMREMFSKEVGVSNAGSTMSYTIQTGRSGLPEVDVVDPGEYYTTFCPICGYNDHHTLYVNHMFGCAVEDLPNQTLTHLIVCYHCHAEQQTYRTPAGDWQSPLLTGFLPYLNKREKGVLPKLLTIDPSLVKPTVRVPPPPTVPLTSLPGDHPAIQYLLGRVPWGREFPVDPLYIEEAYGVGYVDEFVFQLTEDDVIGRSHQMAHQRLVMPIVKDGQVVTWQARTIEEDGKPRWYFPPGPKGAPFLNWDIASCYRGVILVEGFFDAVMAGPSSLALFNCNLNFAKACDIAKQWDYVIIAVDPTEMAPHIQSSDGRVREGAAHIIRRRLTEAGVKNPPILYPYPPGSIDPGAMGPKAFWYGIQQLPKEYVRAVSVIARSVA